MMTLAERGVSARQYVADLRAAWRAWGTAPKLGAEVGVSPATIYANCNGSLAPTQRLVDWLYGPRGGRLVARGPDSRPIPSAVVPDDLPPPPVGDDEAEGADAAPAPDEDADGEGEPVEYSGYLHVVSEPGCPDVARRVALTTALEVLREERARLECEIEALETRLGGVVATIMGIEELF